MPKRVSNLPRLSIDYIRHSMVKSMLLRQNHKLGYTRRLNNCIGNCTWKQNQLKTFWLNLCMEQLLQQMLQKLQILTVKDLTFMIVVNNTDLLALAGILPVLSQLRKYINDKANPANVLNIQSLIIPGTLRLPLDTISPPRMFPSAPPTTTATPTPKQPHVVPNQM